MTHDEYKVYLAELKSDESDIEHCSLDELKAYKINEVNDEIAVALKNNDINGFINANNTIQESLGYKTQFSSFAEFDKFMSK